jgi:hemerythrin-like domain-containing protein
MNALEILSNEHGLIRQFLDNIAMASEKIENGQRPPGEFFVKAVEFARSFADKYHHFKEEHVMFVRLAQKKSGAIDAQLETLRFQHERGRSMVSEIEKAVDGYTRDDSQATTKMLENMASYTSLLRHHIHTEDHIFYPMVQQELSGEEMDLLLQEFEKERERAGGMAFEHSHKLVVDMGSILVHMEA